MPLTPNEQKAADILYTYCVPAGYNVKAIVEATVKRLSAADLLVTPDHEDALAKCEALEKCRVARSEAKDNPNFIDWTPSAVAEAQAVGRRSLDAKKPKERWTVRFGHGMNRWFVYLDGEAVGRDFPADAEPEARAYVARKNAKEAGR